MRKDLQKIYLVTDLIPGNTMNSNNLIISKLFKNGQKIWTLHQRCEWPINIKRFSPSFIFGKMQIKTTMRWHYTPTSIAKIKLADNNKCRLRVWSKWNSWTLLLEHGTDALKNSLGVSYKVKHILKCDHRNTPRYLPKTKELYLNGNSSLFHNSPKPETAPCPSADGWWTYI